MRKAAAVAFTLRGLDATAAPGIMGPGLRRDDAKELSPARPLPDRRWQGGRPTPHAATGCSTVSRESHDEIVAGIKPTRPYIMN